MTQKRVDARQQLDRVVEARASVISLGSQHIAPKLQLLDLAAGKFRGGLESFVHHF